MLPPTTQEEVDRRDNLVNKVSLVRDIMDTVADVENPATKLKILKSLLSSTITDSEVIQLLQEEIDALEQQEQEALEDENTSDDLISDEDNEDIGSLLNGSDSMSDDVLSDEASSDELADSEELSDESDDESLPTPADLDIGDLSDSTNPNLD